MNIDHTLFLQRDALGRAASVCALAASLAVAACGSPQPVSAPSLAATDVAARRVERARDDAMNAAWSLPSYDTRARHNAAPCDCPPWEVRVGRSWRRAALEGADALVAPRAGEAVDVRVRFTRATVESDTGWRYPVFELLDDEE